MVRMYGETAGLYDLTHETQGRDVDAKADLVIAEPHRLRPDARSLLGVACGTGANRIWFASRRPTRWPEST